MNKRVEAWHFLGKDKRLGYGDDRLVRVGGTLSVGGTPVLCKRGLHGSINAIDALMYAPGPIITRVVLSGEIIYSDDKVVATERTVIAMADATDLLFEFACWVAEECLRARQAEGYIFEQATFDAIQARRDFQAGKISKEVLRAAHSAAWSAAESAAYSAAESAAESAAASAAYSAAASAAESAAYSAAYSAAESAAESAAYSAAESAAYSAAYSAAESAAYSAAWNILNEELEKRLTALLGLSINPQAKDGTLFFGGTMDTCLMLGGPLDGRLSMIEEGRDTFPVLEFQSMTDLVTHEGAEPPKYDQAFETILYKRELLRSIPRGREYHVFNAQDRVPPLFRLLKGCARSPYHLKHERTLFIGGPLDGESLRTYVTSANIEGQRYYRQDLKEGSTYFYIYTTTMYSDPIRELLNKYEKTHGKNRR